MAKPRLETGAILDGFRVGPLIHQGGMAMLWEVTRPDLDMPLLMKVPLLFEGEDPAAIVSFEMEQMILPRITGPHVPQFIAAGDFDVQPYIVMERIAGGSLLPYLEKLPLPVAEVTEIGARVATALDDLHRQHVVHLDIKPSNVMRRPTGEAVLIDFGLSRHDLLPDLMEEEFRLPYGTAPYIAPEQVLGIRSEPRSDLFSLGVLLYFFTTGERPFGDPKGLQGYKRRLWRDPVPPLALRADCPPALQEIILRCLEPNPANRYPTAAQLAFDLRNLDMVTLTARAAKRRQDGYFKALRRRWNPEGIAPLRQGAASRDLAAAPIVVVAIDLSEQGPGLAEALRFEVLRTVATLPGARVACLNVLRQHRIAMDTTLDAAGHNKHVQRLVELKHWAAPLQLPPERLTFHVLEAVDPAAAILDYARQNRVDQIVMGARANSTRRKLLGSVAGQVASEAPCTVTVVRQRRAEAAEPEAAAAPAGEEVSPA